MRIWLIGAGSTGAATLRQLQKNPDIDVVVSDPSPRPLAVREGLIEKVDYQETVNSVNINHLARRIRPYLIRSRRRRGRGAGRVGRGAGPALALNYEIGATANIR